MCELRVGKAIIAAQAVQHILSTAVDTAVRQARRREAEEVAADILDLVIERVEIRKTYGLQCSIIDHEDVAALTLTQQRVEELERENKGLKLQVDHVTSNFSRYKSQQHKESSLLHKTLKKFDDKENSKRIVMSAVVSRETLKREPTPCRQPSISAKPQLHLTKPAEFLAKVSSSSKVLQAADDVLKS